MVSSTTASLVVSSGPDPPGDLAEFLTLSLWDSLDAVRAFAGEDVERAVFYPEDDHWLIERDPLARHYLVAAASAHADHPAGS